MEAQIGDDYGLRKPRNPFGSFFLASQEKVRDSQFDSRSESELKEHSFRGFFFQAEATNLGAAY